MNLAIIPASGGSVRLKNKNKIDFHGLPLLAHTISSAKESGIFDVIHVSTDDQSIADIALDFNADVPFLQSQKNSSSAATSMSVIKEVLECYEKLGKTFVNIVLLQPTSPLRTATDIINSFKLLNSNVYSVISVTKNDNNEMLKDYFESKNHLKEWSHKELLGDYLINGAIYIVKSENIADDIFYNSKSVLYEMPALSSIDINTLDDLNLAKKLFKSN
jgi:CMP-N,N'-diacetyllegionaminic acid synthase